MERLRSALEDTPKNASPLRPLRRDIALATRWNVKWYRRRVGSRLVRRIVGRRPIARTRTMNRRIRTWTTRTYVNRANIPPLDA